MSNKQDQIYRGIIYACIAFSCVSIMNALSKLLIDDHSVFEIAFYRYFISALILSAYFLLIERKKTDGPGLKIHKWKILLARSVVSASALIIMFSATQYTSISNIAALILTSALITPILAIFVLKEKIGLHRWAAICLGFLGAYIIIAPQGSWLQMGIILSLIAAFCHACTDIFLRYLRDESAFAVTFYYTWGAAIMCVAFMPFVAAPLTQFDIFILGLCGIFGSILQITIVLAFKYAPASFIAPFHYMKVLAAALLDILIWTQVPGWPIFLGSAIIIGSKCYMIYREKRFEPTPN